jgi:hypothetical protein
MAALSSETLTAGTPGPALPAAPSLAAREVLAGLDDPALLRICHQYASPGIRIAWELDYQTAEPLGLALGEAVRLGGDIMINMSSLAFVDARCKLMIAVASNRRRLRPARARRRPRHPAGAASGDR